MERKFLRFGKDGCMKLPVGYRFYPTDEVLVNYYLKKRVLCEPLPADVIPEVDVFQIEPWALPGVGKNCKEEKYFFFNSKGCVFVNQNKRVAGSGHWREEGESKKLVPTGIRGLFGKKSILKFWHGEVAAEKKTRWEMHEFRLVSTSNPSKVSNWAVYRVILKKAAKKAGKKKAKRVHKKASKSSNVVVYLTEESESGYVTGPSSPITP